VADWNHDGLPDIIVNSIWGKVLWYENVGTRRHPRLAAAKPIEVEWKGTPPRPAWNWWRPKGKNLATQWRTTPAVLDFDSDGLNDLVMLDHEGYLVLFERIRQDRRLKLLPPKRIFVCENVSVFDSIHRSKNKTSGMLRLNDGSAGKSGRRKFCFVDWNLDGRLDVLVNSRNVSFLRKTGQANGKHALTDDGMVDDRILAGHTTSPTTVDWNKDGIGDLLVGAEDGFLYYMQNPNSKATP